MQPNLTMKPNAAKRSQEQNLQPQAPKSPPPEPVRREPRTISFQPTARVRILVNVAEQLLFPQNKSEFINEILASALPGIIESRGPERQAELAALLERYESTKPAHRCR